MGILDFNTESIVLPEGTLQPDQLQSLIYRWSYFCLSHDCKALAKSFAKSNALESIKISSKACSTKP